MSTSLQSYPHRRLNILTGEWILVSPQRNLRPWNGKIENVNKQPIPAFEPTCYLCPGNSRAGNYSNPDYRDVYIFENDFASLLPDTPASNESNNPLLIHRTERGICKVICYSPRHDITMARMSISELEKIIRAWIHEYDTLGKQDFINSVLIFENKGELMGCSNPHPHGQIWAQESLPGEIEKEYRYQKEYYQKNKCTLLSDYLKTELKEKSRVVAENEHFVCVVPYWAHWPFETLLVSKRPFGSLAEIDKHEISPLAEMLKHITIKYDNLFECDFPYSMGLHQSPTDGKPHPEWHFHIHFYPPLLRSSQIKKFMVGYELLGEVQRDLLPEKSAEIIRNLAPEHYSEKNK